MKQIRQHIINGLLLLTIVSISSCESILEDESPATATGKNVELSFTRGIASATAESFNVLLFSDDYSTVKTLSSDNGVDTYKENPWDTGMPYPLSGQVHAVGYAPINNIELTTTSSKGVAISIKDQQPGTIDVCASQTETGSKSAPFNQSKSLKFAHLTTRVSFYAMRHNHMAGSRTVGNISITVPHDYATDTWTYSNGGTFTPTAASKVFGDISLNFADQLVNLDEKYLVGTCYLNLNGQSILQNITIAADIAPVGSSNVDRISGVKEIQLMNENGGIQSTTNIGEAYEVTIRFTQNSFTFEAVKEEWLPGGLITVPIDPSKSDSK